MKNDLDNDQLTISYELLVLVRWLITHDQEKLKKIISKALTSGLNKELQKIDYTTDATTLNEMQYNISDFFGLLESLLIESMQEQLEKNVKEQNLSPSIEHIDSTVCDNQTVQISLEKATNKIAKNPKENPKDLLFQELLKQWKPNNKLSIN